MRLLCDHHIRNRGTLSCNFHDTCIESLYPAGKEGFSLSYALPRCNAVRAFTHSNSSCSNCLRTSGLDTWLLQSELCLQSKMIPLARKWAEKKRGQDPMDRLSFEEESFKELNSCYNKSQLANIISSGIAPQEDIKSDLIKILNSLTIKPYYRSLVQQLFRSLLSQPLLDQVVPPVPLRVLFCAVGNANTRISVETKIQKMAEELQSDKQQFSLSSDNDAFNELCGRKSPANPPEDNVSLQRTFSVIQWLPSSSEAGKVENLRGHYSLNLPKTTTRLIFYEYATKEESYCGNGIREAGEECDMAADNELELGCEENCKISSDYECSTEQGSRSTCFEPVCGDGRRDSTEECDDANTVSGDGCSDCRIDSGFTCSQLYNVTSKCDPIPSPSSSTVSSSVFSYVIPSSNTLTSTTIPSPSNLPTEDSVVSEPLTSSGRQVLPRTLISLLLPLLLMLALVSSTLR